MSSAISGLFIKKTLLITGGTGSFGNAVLDRFLSTDIEEIRVFSRDELKQDEMRRKIQEKYPKTSVKVKFFIGDVRDIHSIRNAISGVDYIFHAAALKQVPSCEFFPLEAVKTNILGTENVLTAAIEAGVKRVVCLSTDKAAYPINAMGTSKAMMEKIIFAKSRTVSSDCTTICCTRYGNVMCSRGSVIPLFVEKIKCGFPLTITDGSMTRFIMDLDEAIDLVLFAFENANQGDLFVQKADATTIDVLTQAIKNLFGVPNYPIINIGVRHGEKYFETLLTNEECARSIDEGNFYRVYADSRDLNYEKFYSQGHENSKLIEFNSNNTKLLSVEQTERKLLESSYFVKELNEWNARRMISE